MSSSRPTLFIFDANAMLHRAWHSLPPLTNPEGQVVNAVYGVTRYALKLLQDYHPDACVACWDTKAPTFRHQAYEAYKAHREKQPDELYAQVPLLHEGLAALGIPSVSLDGFEADDLIGTIAMRAVAENWEVVIVTGDRDALQLLGDHVSVLTFVKGVSETFTYTENVLMEEFGLTPAQFVEYKAMRGDPSDNIPGIKGIGEKGATELLKKYGTLEGIFQAAHDEKAELTPSVRAKLLAGEADVEATLDLVRIRTDVPFVWALEKQTFAPNGEAAQAFFTRMGFKTLLKEGSKKSDAVSPISKQKTAASEGQVSLPVHTETITWTEVTDEKRLLVVLEEYRNAPELLIYVHAGEASLFAQQLHNIVLVHDAKGIWFPDTLLASQAACEALRLIIESAARRVTHDAKGQRKLLCAYGLRINDWQFDTLLAAYLLQAGDRVYDLSSLAVRYRIEPATITSATDAGELLHALVPCLQAELEREKLTAILEKYELPLVPVLAQMEEHGILLDVAYLRTLTTELQRDKKAVEKKMEESVGVPFNPASPAQLSEVLFTTLALPSKGIKRGKTAFSTAASELEKLRGLHPLIELIEEYRELAKMLSTYVETLPEQVDAQSRVHTTYQQVIAATGRLSSIDPNLQNIPIRTELGRRIRKAFIAAPGFTLLSCDYSQIELRLIAAISHDERMLAAFRAKEDIHKATAAAIWNVPLAEVTTDQRRIAKAINFGIIFGQEPHGLSQVAGISFADAKKFIDTYFEVYQGVRKYMTETKSLAHIQGFVETLSGRRRYLPDLNSNMHPLRAAAERMAINMPIQGTDADLMKHAMIVVGRELPAFSKKTALLLQVHDELVLEVPDEEVRAVAAFVKERMETVEEFGVPIVVEAKAGKNWAEMKPLEI